MKGKSKGKADKAKADKAKADKEFIAAMRRILGALGTLVNFSIAITRIKSEMAKELKREIEKDMNPAPSNLKFMNEELRKSKGSRKCKSRLTHK